jgi:citrate lyase beta subunit
MNFHPRSMLFVSGEKSERFARAFDAGADLVCIDLEDAVHPARKAEARQRVLAWLADNPDPAGGARRALRVNGIRTLEGLRDLLALAESGIALDALLVPKVESAADLHCLGAWLGERAPAVVALLETPSAIEQAGGIARAGSPLAALMLGGADLSAEIGANFDWTGLLHARGRLVNAAKAGGLQAWDVPHIALDDLADLVDETRRAIAMGFDCKTAIHPRQIDPIHSAFAPTAAEAEWAKALLQAMPPDGASGAFLFQGRMVDAPVIRKARRIVARAASNRSQPPGDTPDGPDSQEGR